MPRKEVFLSYGHGGYASVCRSLAYCLLARGHKVWFDEIELRGGEDWAEEMASGIRDSRSGLDKLVVFVLDYWGCRRGSSGAGFCLNEVMLIGY